MNTPQVVCIAVILLLLVFKALMSIPWGTDGPFDRARFGGLICLITGGPNCGGGH
jgi:hypothetical protein